MLWPAQQNSLRRLHLFADSDLYPLDSSNKRFFQKFEGLRDLRLWIRFYRFGDSKGEDKCMRSLLHFGRGQLTSAKVLISVGNFQTATKQARNRAKELEDGLMVSRQHREAKKVARAKRVKDLAEQRAEQQVEWEQHRVDARSTWRLRSLKD